MSAFSRTRRRLLQAGALVAATGASSARADWPARPIRIIVPFAPGAGTDALGRLLAQKLGEALASPCLVENRSGATGAIGTQHVAQSPPDGHTLLLIASPFTTVPAVLNRPSHDPVRDFTPISLIAQGPLLWAARRDLPVRSLGELVAMARQRPGALNYGSAGAGGINHLALELLKAHAGVHITHIAYRGVAPAALDMIAGHIDLITGTIPALLPFIRDGLVKALAVSSRARCAALPEIAGMLESGFGDVEVLNYFGLVAPAATPARPIERLNRALEHVMGQAEIIERFRADALEIAPLGPGPLAAFLAADHVRWRQLADRQGLRTDAL